MIPSPNTQLYGVIGNPVKHSASPRLFNTIFQEKNYDGVYLGFENASIKKLISAMKSLSIAGYSVTIPFKERVMEYLDELDNSAVLLGCANTIWNKGGKLIGYNFDGRGALAGLDDFFQNQKDWDWRNVTIVFLGNGGAARGIILSLVQEPKFHGHIVVVARNTTKTDALLQDAVVLNPKASFSSLPWPLRSLDQSNQKKIQNMNLNSDRLVVVNTTSLGMFPDVNETPVSRDFWKPGMLAYDIVYNPLRTRFLKEAEESGAQTLNGIHMFLGQARLQLLTWTGMDLPLSEIRDLFHRGQEARH